jgi:hypothetical protein
MLLNEFLTSCRLLSLGLVTITERVEQRQQQPRETTAERQTSLNLISYPFLFEVVSGVKMRFFSCFSLFNNQQ